jgi:hypothetical protein
MSRVAKWTVLLFAMCLLHIPVNATSDANKEGRTDPASAVSGAESTSPPQTEEPPTIEWFKEELRISPKYAEESQGVFGVSWAHFMTMLFLVLFFVLGLATLLIRYKRTRKLLTTLLEEKEDADN